MYWFLCWAVATLVLLSSAYSQHTSNTTEHPSEAKTEGLKKSRDGKSKRKKTSKSGNTVSKEKVRRDESAGKTSKPKEGRITGGRAVGTTADGKTIYEGPRGGRFYYNDKGKKVYLKKR